MPVAVPCPARRGLGPRGRRRIAGAGLGALLVATAGFVARPAGGAVGHRLASTVMHRSALRAAAAPTCLKAAPTTAGGYAAMFAALDPRQWGGGDLAISVPLDGRTVWLFGDTVSTNRFVHSTAVVQFGGCLHVSSGGRQLLPDEHAVARPTPSDPSTVYWIESAGALGPRTLAVTARAVELAGTRPWDFRDGGYQRTGLVDVDDAGEVTFRRWLTTTHGAPRDPGPLIDCEAPAPPRPHHLCYGRHRHPELHLADGRVLVTVSQNWDDGVLRPLADYRPLFRAG